MSTINIFGSTGTIGKKTLNLINSYFPKIQINLLTANTNYKLLANQAIKYNSKYICIKDNLKKKLLKKLIFKKNIKIIDHSDLKNYLLENKSDMSILSISGNSALEYLEPIIKSTSYLGLVNKECIVSAGFLLRDLCKNHSTKLFCIDSEHYSLQNFFDKLTNHNYKGINNIFLTASGGPFLHKNKNFLSKVTFNQTIKHPKWKMGIKNSIDSATLVNKCLEIIEAHYLFNIDYKKLNIIIHPQALVHSIVEYDNLTSFMNYFYHDMDIPIFNYLKHNNKLIKIDKLKDNYKFNKNSKFNFEIPKYNNFPILKIFKNLDKSDHRNIIKFNVANEFAVDLFSRKIINFTNIYKIIDKSMNLDINFKLNDVNSIINYQELFNNKLKFKFKLVGS